MKIPLGIVAILGLLCALGCYSTTPSPTTLPADGARAVGDSVPPVDIASSFEISMPEQDSWTILNDGKIKNLESTYLKVVADLDRGIQFSVTVMPISKDGDTLDKIKDDWEIGFTRKMTMRHASKMGELNGQPAYTVVGEVSDGDERFEIAGILLVKNNRTYVLGITKLGSDILNDPEVRAFTGSFRFKE